MTEINNCKNCEERLQGEFCHHCGQSTKVIRKPFYDLGTELLNGIFQWDNRLVRSLKLLFFHPAKLTKEWIEGRRVRYVNPFRLYLISSIFLFLIIGLSMKNETFTFSEGNDVIHDTGKIQEALDKSISEERLVTSIFLQATLHLIEDPARFFNNVTTALPKAAFLCLPIFGLICMLLYGRKEYFFLDYLVFSLHFHAFVFFTLGILFLIPQILPFLSASSGVLYLIIPTYLVLSFKRLNPEEKFLITILKPLFGLGVYLFVLTVFVAVFLSTILIMGSVTN